MTIEESTKKDATFILNKFGFKIEDFKIEIKTKSPAPPNGYVKVEYKFYRKSNNISKSYGGKWMEDFEKDLKAQVFGVP